MPSWAISSSGDTSVVFAMDLSRNGLDRANCNGENTFTSTSTTNIQTVGYMLHPMNGILLSCEIEVILNMNRKIIDQYPI